MPSQSLLDLLANGTRGPATTRPAEEPPYDHRGAMWFVVTVVTVYAMAILFMIVSHINRRAGKRELDRAVSAFLRSAPTVRIEEERQHRRNLKRAMQPFIRLALDRRTVGVLVRVAAGSGHLLTEGGSVDALHGIPGQPMSSASAERLAVSDRVVVVSSRRSSRATRRPSKLQPFQPSLQTAESLESGWQSDSAADKLDASSAGGAASASGVVCAGPNEKAVQCGLDPRETLASRAQRLRPVASVNELLGSSAYSLQYRALQQQQQLPPESPQQQQQQQQQPIQNELDDQDATTQMVGDFAYFGVSASRTHVPRFLAVPGGVGRLSRSRFHSEFV